MAAILIPVVAEVVEGLVAAAEGGAVAAEAAVGAGAAISEGAAVAEAGAVAAAPEGAAGVGILDGEPIPENVEAIAQNAGFFPVPEGVLPDLGPDVLN